MNDEIDCTAMSYIYFKEIDRNFLHKSILKIFNKRRVA